MFFLTDYEEASIARLVAETHFRDVTNRGVASRHKDIATLGEIWTDILNHTFTKTIIQFLDDAFIHAETHNHAIYGSFFGRLTVPAECAVGKIDVHIAFVEQHIPQHRHLCPLAYRIGGYECNLNIPVNGGLPIT